MTQDDAGETLLSGPSSRSRTDIIGFQRAVERPRLRPRHLQRPPFSPAEVGQRELLISSAQPLSTHDMHAHVANSREAAGAGLSARRGQNKKLPHQDWLDAFTPYALGPACRVAAAADHLCALFRDLRLRFCLARFQSSHRTGRPRSSFCFAAGSWRQTRTIWPALGSGRGPLAASGRARARVCVRVCVQAGSFTFGLVFAFASFSCLI